LSVRFVIYEWDAWWQFKLVRAVPEAGRLTATPGESADEVLARCPPGASAFAFHINATYSVEFPHRRAALVSGLEARGIVPINASVVDISKRWVQAQCAASGLPVAAASVDGDADERVIVKTDQNYGGRSERLLTEAQRTALGLSRPSTEVSSAHEYPVMPRRDVPAAWWADPALAIERYIANRAHVIYRVSVAGNRVDILRIVNPQLIKKVDGAQTVTTLFGTRDQLERGTVSGLEADVGRTIVRFLAQARMDFCGLDVVADDVGRAYVIDVNTTPFGLINSLRRLMNMRRGLFEFVEERRARLPGARPGLGRATWPTPPMVVGEVKRLVATLRTTSH
jgi:hypothetical protein